MGYCCPNPAVWLRAEYASEGEAQQAVNSSALLSGCLCPKPLMHGLQDLLENLLLARDEAGAGMSDAAARDELMTLLVAGQVPEP